jgi:hypothetical protein
LLGIVAAAGIAVGAVASCDLKDRSYKDDSTLPGTFASVRVDNGSGGVTLNGVPSGHTLTLHRKVSYRGHKPGKATYRIEKGVLVLGGCGSGCSVGYTVDVPEGTPVSGKVSNGAVELSRVGPVQVVTGSGHIGLHSVTGPVSVVTTNGRITGEDVRSGSVVARTTNGRIDLALTSPADVRARTSNGSVSLTVPQATYRVTAETHNGSRHIGVPNAPSGRHQLTLQTTNGDITVKHG